ncbi:MAG: hypothetical protein AMXMBFR47_32620 [Planctomycetota bacterium]
MKRYSNLFWPVLGSLAIGVSAWADIPGDADRDGDLDFADFAAFADCHGGPAIPGSAACQELFDYDADTAIDLHDLAAFQQCFSGENQAADPNCAAHVFRIVDGCLQIIGTAADTTLALRLAPGAPNFLHVDFGNDGNPDFSFDRSQFDCIVINARGGDDVMFIDESNGVFTTTEATTILGGSGNDTLLGGSGSEVYIGGPGNDSIFAGPGADRLIWNDGDGADLNEGSEGIDTVEVNGGGESENFTVTANGTRVRFDRLAPTPFFLDIGGCEHLLLQAGSGDDSLACTGNLAALIQITADGGDGSDTLRGSNGADVLIGGDGDDFVDGQQGNDVAMLGAGNDTFQWDPGDGSDTVEGQDGVDTILFNGSNGSEIFSFSANGSRLRFTRDLGNILLDADDVEGFDLNALGGIDTVNAGNLAGTDVAQINVDLGGFGGTADAAADTVNIVSSAAAETFNISADGGFVIVELAAEVRVRGYEPLDQFVVSGVGGDTVNVHGSAGPDTMTVIANGTQARVDATGYSLGIGLSGALSLTVRALGGDDTIACTGNLAGLLIPLTLDGGADDDVVLGSNGADVLLGGDGNDLVDGQQGNDTAFLGAGDDVFQWDPGDGSDSIEGQDGDDAIAFNGSAAAEILDFSANGQRLRFTRNIGTIVMDAAGVEQFDLQALGGADIVTVNDLTGTGVVQASISLAGTLGGSTGDTLADSVIVNGTSAPDSIGVAGGITGTVVTGLSTFVSISTAEATLDRLTVNGLGGGDTIHATGLPGGVIGLTLSGGAGDDELVGSGGGDLLSGDDDDDMLIGGDGDDTLQGGLGNDRLVWNPGDDTDLVEGGDGVDTVEVNGGSGAEDFTVTANGTRVRFDRIIPTPFFLDIGTCENLVLNANGGNDTLACTGNLAALIQITADGGAGDDRLLGSNGADVLIGGDDNDFVDGNQGNDTIFLGAGDDTFQWDPGDGSDSVEGQNGQDAIVFNGSSAAETYDFSASGQRLRFTRNIGSVILDADGIERFDLNALGGADLATVNSLAGTAVAQINIDLAIFGGGGDASADSITVNGTDAADTIGINANAGAVEVSGLAAFVRITRSESTLDRLTVNGLGGTDTITPGPGVSSLIILTVNQ